jgi:hypothetical protein
MQFIDTDHTLSSVLGVDDPIERIKRVGDALTEIKHLTAELGRARREDIEALMDAGMSQNEIGRRIGLTSSRMSQLIASGPPPERAFFGTRGGKPVIAAVAEKLEADKAKPGPVVSINDMQAYDKLRRLVEDLGLTSTYEVVRPPGNVRLNRDGLVLVCGPRHSALIAQVLEADEKLRFEKRDVWCLIDRISGTTYRSPEDFDEPGDIAYFGRLPRPDGKGTFLYMAGIHAAGAAGVVHYLSGEIATLFREVRNRRFSMLISCRYDPETHEIISSERITPIYRHDT